MAGNSQTPRTAKSRVKAQPRSGRTRRRNGGAPGDVMNDEIALDALAGHAGYAVRRFQIWIFQDFIRTLSAVDIRPTQYSVMTVIGANPGLTQMAVAKRLGIERARLVHLLDSLEQRDLVVHDVARRATVSAWRPAGRRARFCTRFGRSGHLTVSRHGLFLVALRAPHGNIVVDDNNCCAQHWGKRPFELHAGMMRGNPEPAGTGGSHDPRRRKP
jgi:hypothetical protein